jgi:penicillin-insensitive murein endopeptidase
MRPSRLRYFGHPELVDFVRKLSARVHEKGRGLLLIGDLSQPRGGRSNGGHASHQTGLDVDVWFWHPKRARKAPLSLTEREDLGAPSILDRKRGAIRQAWKQHVAEVLSLAVADARVERVFVNPHIKRELCALPDTDKSWLRKVRPWHGHDDHFHARLSCPADDAHCRPQAPLPAGDGCDQLGFWFDAAAQAARAKAQATYQRSVDVGRRWPELCDALLDATSPSAQGG